MRAGLDGLCSQLGTPPLLPPAHVSSLVHPGELEGCNGINTKPSPSPALEKPSVQRRNRQENNQSHLKVMTTIHSSGKGEQHK